MTLKIEDVEAGDWLTCVDADDSPLMEGHDYQIAKIDGDYGGYVAFSGVTDGPFAVSRFTRRQFRVGDVVEIVTSHRPKLHEGDRCLVASIESFGRYATLQTENFDVVQDVPVDEFRLITPAHLVAKSRTESEQAEPTNDAVNHPSHYTSHPSGVECIEITQHMNFCRGNAMKYIWRAGEKGDEVEDLRKAAWYLDCEIKRLEKHREKGGAK